MTICSVPLCANKSKDGIGIFGLPKSDETRVKWLRFLQKCGKNIEVGKNYTICETHFHPYDLQYTSRNLLRPGAVPMINNNQVSA